MILVLERRGTFLTTRIFCRFSNVTNAKGAGSFLVALRRHQSTKAVHNLHLVLLLSIPGNQHENPFIASLRGSNAKGECTYDKSYA